MSIMIYSQKISPCGGSPSQAIVAMPASPQTTEDRESVNSSTAQRKMSSPKKKKLHTEAKPSQKLERLQSSRLGEERGDGEKDEAEGEP